MTRRHKDTPDRAVDAVWDRAYLHSSAKVRGHRPRLQFAETKRKADGETDRVTGCAMNVVALSTSRFKSSQGRRGLVSATSTTSKPDARIEASCPSSR